MQSSKVYTAATFIVNAMVFLGLTLCSSVSIAQQQQAKNNNILYNRMPQITSPNAAAIEKYVDFPTATYTGVPDISFPLLQLGIKGVQVPISISYHAAGIKVDDVSSDVGAGWSLMAGGAISIQPNGLIDEISGFPNLPGGAFLKVKNNTLQANYAGGVINCDLAAMYQDPYVDPYGLYTGGDIAILGGVMNGNYDTEPDYYSFNFPGGSGKFFQDENGVFRTIPYSETKIERLPAGGYKITDINGNAFTFSVKEESRDIQTNAASSEQPTETKNRTYYLTSISNPQGESVQFFYSALTYSYQTQNTYSRALTSMVSDCYQMNTSPPYYYNSWTYGSVIVEGQKIDSIRCSDGSMVRFNYSATNRTDLAGNKAITSIEQWQYLFGRKLVKRFTLNHGYSGGRLVLNSFQEEGKPSTAFTYNGSLPVRLSKAQDHFGYYNAQEANTTLLPMDEYRDFNDGANRDVVEMYAKAGILTTVEHPTGGKTEYEYESNRYYVPTTTTRYTKTVGPHVFSLPNQTVSSNFTIPSGASKITIVYQNTFDGSEYQNDECRVRITGANNFLLEYLGNSPSRGVELTLPAGQYTLSIYNVGNTYSANAVISWFTAELLAPHEELGGGLRIKSIKKSDGTGRFELQRFFEYKLAATNQSSGVNTTAPNYVSYSYQETKRTSPFISTSCITQSCQLTVQSSVPVVPLAFGNGSSVLYSEVSTYLIDKTQNGYSRLVFNIAPYNATLSPYTFPNPPRVLFDWVNGTLLEQYDYRYRNNAYELIKSTKNTYNYNIFDPVVHTNNLHVTYGVKVGVIDAPFICHAACTGAGFTSYYPVYFGLNPFKLYSSWHRLDKTEEKLYTPENGQVITSITEYFSDNPNSILQNRVQTYNSKGEKKTQYIKYPKDYSQYGFAEQLVQKNILQSPVERYSVLQKPNQANYVTDGEVVEYNGTNGLPLTMYSFESASPLALSSFSPSTMPSSGTLAKDSRYRLKASINEYNAIGNILEIQQTDGQKTSLLWDFALAKPIAEVKNAGRADIAYTSFEGDAQGNWTSSGGTLNTVSPGSYCPTGSKYYSMGGGSSFSKSVTSGNAYIISFWTSSTQSFSIQGGTQVYAKQGMTVQGWKYMEFKITATSAQLQLTGTGNIDELRLYPADAMMTTYTYDPFVGITSSCDANNKITYYEYDAVNRVKLIRDQEWNIVKTFQYNYQQQQ